MKNLDCNQIKNFINLEIIAEKDKDDNNNNNNHNNNNNNKNSIF